jgi:SAM-dependent methyltransferase
VDGVYSWGVIVLDSGEKSMLARWSETPLGAYALAWEQTQIDAAVEDVFGFNALQIGTPEIDYLRMNRMPTRFVLGPQAACQVRGELMQWPIATQSIDLVVLAHVLEFSEQPHQLLRELERVLVPEGQVVIAGFNTLSLWGLRQWMMPRQTRKLREGPWSGQFIGLLRLKDWLQLLGFELNGGQFGCYAPPFSSPQWLSRCRFLEPAGARWWPIAGSVYVVRAVKRTLGMRMLTPMRRTERARRAAVATMARQRETGVCLSNQPERV